MPGGGAVGRCPRTPKIARSPVRDAVNCSNTPNDGPE